MDDAWWQYLFNFARELKAIPSLTAAEPSELRACVKLWLERATVQGIEKDFDTVATEFGKCWSKIKYPAGTGPIFDAMKKADSLGYPDGLDDYSPGVARLCALCRELYRTSRPQPFYLGCRAAGEVLGVSHATASKWLQLLELMERAIKTVEVGRLDAVVEDKKRNQRKRPRASRFIYLWPIEPEPAPVLDDDEPF